MRCIGLLYVLATCNTQHLPWHSDQFNKATQMYVFPNGFSQSSLATANCGTICQNGGTSNEIVFGSSDYGTVCSPCSCVGTGFTGTFCEVPVWQCPESNPCFNGGTCVSAAAGSQDSWSCQCTNDFTGKTCAHYPVGNPDFGYWYLKGSVPVFQGDNRQVSDQVCSTDEFVGNIRNDGSALQDDTISGAAQTVCADLRIPNQFASEVDNAQVVRINTIASVYSPHERVSYEYYVASNGKVGISMHKCSADTSMYTGYHGWGWATDLSSGVDYPHCAGVSNNQPDELSATFSNLLDQNWHHVCWSFQHSEEDATRLVWSMSVDSERVSGNDQSVAPMGNEQGTYAISIGSKLTSLRSGSNLHVGIYPWQSKTSPTYKYVFLVDMRDLRVWGGSKLITGIESNQIMARGYLPPVVWFQINSDADTSNAANTDTIASGSVDIVDRVGTFSAQRLRCTHSPSGVMGASAALNIEANGGKCVTEPCLNNGVCKFIGVKERTCDCSNTGFTGTRCGDLLDQCHENGDLTKPIHVCQNGGTCVTHEDGSGYECQNCPSGTYQGQDTKCQSVQYCDTADACGKNQNRGACAENIFTNEATGHSYSIGRNCTCASGWTGSDCNTQIMFCETTPCKHGNPCHDLLGTYRCGDRQPNGDYHCVAGTQHANGEDTTCSVDINECQTQGGDVNCDPNSPITGKGGTCVDELNAYRCECKDDESTPFQDWGGHHCDELLDHCVDENGFERDCGAGTCVSETGDWRCICQVDGIDTGYTQTGGDKYAKCDAQPNGCTDAGISNPCVHGNCMPKTVAEIQSDPTANKFRCGPCDAGWTLDSTTGTCTKDFSECGAYNPCGAHGTCFEGTNSTPTMEGTGEYYCICDSGYTDHPSLRLQHMRTYLGWVEGRRRCWGAMDPDDAANCDCAFEVNECFEYKRANNWQSPCKNGGLCVDQTNGFSCDCQNTGFSGFTCEDQVDICTTTSPCQNLLKADGVTPTGVQCVNKINSYQCVCNEEQSGFTGPTCGEEVDACTITNADGSTEPYCVTGTCLKTTEPPFAQCVCSGTGKGGDRCDEDIEKCIVAGQSMCVGPNPASPRGTCAPRDTADDDGYFFSCDCDNTASADDPVGSVPLGWSRSENKHWPNCDKREYACDRSIGGNPCGPHGDCSNDPQNYNHFSCKCKDGYSGERCDTPPDYCMTVNPFADPVSQPKCKNGVACSPNALAVAPYYACRGRVVDPTSDPQFPTIGDFCTPSFENPNCKPCEGKGLKGPTCEEDDLHVCQLGDCSYQGTCTATTAAQRLQDPTLGRYTCVCAEPLHPDDPIRGGPKCDQTVQPSQERCNDPSKDICGVDKGRANMIFDWNTMSNVKCLNGCDCKADQWTCEKKTTITVNGAQQEVCMSCDKKIDYCHNWKFWPKTTTGQSDYIDSYGIKQFATTGEYEFGCSRAQRTNCADEDRDEFGQCRPGTTLCDKSFNPCGEAGQCHQDIYVTCSEGAKDGNGNCLIPEKVYCDCAGTGKEQNDDTFWNSNSNYGKLPNCATDIDSCPTEQITHNGQTINACSAAVGSQSVPRCEDLTGNVVSEFGHGYDCLCPSFKEGQHCELWKDFCATAGTNSSSLNCLNGGVCVNNYDYNQAQCDCSNVRGFELNPDGGKCDKEKDGCADNGAGTPCKNGATCMDVTVAEMNADITLGEYRCTCASGWSGPTCETRISSCHYDNDDSRPKCKNQGQCVDCLHTPDAAECVGNDKDYVCKCSIYFTGDHCEIDRDGCEGVSCSGWQCVDVQGSRDDLTTFMCACPADRAGTNCETAVDFCKTGTADEINCVNGNCVSDGLGENGWHCACNPDDAWEVDESTGLCTKDINWCQQVESTYCGNGTCVDNIAPISWLTCNCLPGFITNAGDELPCRSTVPKPCDGQPCQNMNLGVTCSITEAYYNNIMGEALYKCGCANFTGDPVTGHNGCFCDGLEGNDCQSDITNCMPLDICGVGGQCIDKLNAYECACDPGYQNDDDAEMQPNCFKITHACPDPFIGTDGLPLCNGGTCNTSIPLDWGCVCTNVASVGSTEKVAQGPGNDFCADGCADAPCGAHGTCTDTIGGYQCECEDGWFGSRCESNNACTETYILSRWGPEGCKNGHCEPYGTWPLWYGQCVCNTGWDRSTSGICDRDVQNDCPVDTDCGAHGACADDPVVPGQWFCKCEDGWTISTDTEKCDQEYCGAGWCNEAGTSVCSTVTGECVCLPGFTGDRCEISPTPCAPGACKNGFLCNRVSNTSSDFTCTDTGGEVCNPEFYYHPNCRDKPECLINNPCTGDHMTCTEKIGAAPECGCVSGYEMQGGVCVDVDECLNTCTHEHEACTNFNGGHNCACKDGYERVSGVCTQSAIACGAGCQNCNTQTGECVCPNEYWKHELTDNVGSRCVPKPYCTDSTYATLPCSGHGVCSFDDANADGSTETPGWQCACDVGMYTGAKCQTPVNPCDDANFCNGNGQCEFLGAGSAQCNCNTGYDASKNCGEHIQFCNQPGAINCEHGTCGNNEDNTAAECTCFEGYQKDTSGKCTVIQDQCTLTFCNGHGTCSTPTANNPQCACTGYWSGERCDVNNDPCVTSNPCLYSAPCSTTNSNASSLTCDCSGIKVNGVFMGGAYCGEPLTGCAGGTCVATNTVGGTQCTEGSNGAPHQCTCKPGWTGMNCAQDVLECNTLGDPCGITTNRAFSCSENGAGTQNIVCACKAGFSGDRCTIDEATCANTNGCPHGQCVEGFGTAFTCTSCNSGWAGTMCDEDFLECQQGDPCGIQSGYGVSCEEKGVGNGDWECVCAAGRDSSVSSRDCAVDLDLCANSPCGLHSTCAENEAGTDVTCGCVSGYQRVGDECKDIDECDRDSCRGFAPQCDLCNGRAACGNTAGNFTCVGCANGYTGPRCGVVVDPCIGNDCQNDAVCEASADNSEFTCNCDGTGHRGAKCAEDYDLCENSACGEHSTCEETSNGKDKVCGCVSGYQRVGDACVDTDECATGTHECLNGGVCQNSPAGSYSCNCDATNFQGDRCQTQRDGECTATSCNNMPERCSPAAEGQIQCDCVGSGYTGSTCDQEDPTQTFCSADSCHNGGQCVEGTGKATSCECGTKWTGDTCEQCVTTAACGQNGDSCVAHESGDGRHACTCKSGWALSADSDNCDTDETDCTATICENNGVCSEPIELHGTGQFSCNCATTADWNADLSNEGKCTLKQNDCSNSPCQNGGTCQDGDRSFTCACDDNHYGDLCEHEINFCWSRNTDGSKGTDQQCGEVAHEIQGSQLVFDMNAVLGACECGACKPGWEKSNGPHGPCDVRSDPCQNVDCLNGAQCVHNQDYTDYTCTCTTGWTNGGENSKTCGQKVDLCANDACSGGICVDNGDTFSCDCAGVDFDPEQANGPCVNKINDCDGINCGTGGTCKDGIRTHTCECAEFYQLGADGTCEDRNECAVQNWCKHEATCLNFIGTFFCNGCPGEWTGDRCDEDVNECALGTSDCKNGGVCVNKDNGYDCDCPAGWTGERCVEDKNECEENDPCGINESPPRSTACQNVLPDGSGTYSCTCTALYDGPHCDQSVDPCLNKCAHYTEGTCVPLAGGNFTCSGACEPGRATDVTKPLDSNGRNCDGDIDTCSTQNIQCHSGTACVDSAPGDTQEFQCCANNDAGCTGCPSGVRGALCDLCTEGKTEVCALRGASCVATATGPQCVCGQSQENATNAVLGWRCQSPCDASVAAQKCSNHGTCNPLSNGGHTCTCDDGWDSADCNNDISWCTSKSIDCGHGDCVDGVGAEYHCECQQGWQRDTASNQSPCNTDKHDCDTATNAPCVNGGVCQEGSAGSTGSDAFTCLCENTGFVGNTCQQNIDDCACSSIGTDTTFNQDGFTNGCYDKVKDFECRCKDGWGGKACDTNIDDCANSNNQCDSQGTDNTYNGNGFASGCKDNTATTNAVLCYCKSGFVGDRCETNVDSCQRLSDSTPADSVCSNVGTLYTSSEVDGKSFVQGCYDLPDGSGAECLCKPGYEGSDCGINTDDCLDNNACGQFGQCVDGIDGFTCQCNNGYTHQDTNSQSSECVNINECAQTNWCNGGNCVDLPGTFFCGACPAGWNGDRCEADIDECQSNSTHNCGNGQCENVPGWYKCNCEPGYTKPNPNIINSPCTVDINECLAWESHKTGVAQNCNSANRNNSNFACDNCMHGACQNLIGNASCSCDLGWHGSYCDQDTSECNNDAECGPHGTCVDRIGELVDNGLNTYTVRPGEFKCRCDKGWVGAQCETDYSACGTAAEKCLSAGTESCQDTAASALQTSDLYDKHSCTCKYGWSGDTCEVDVSACGTSQETCSSTGTNACVDMLASALSSTDPANKHTCECKDGFAGTRCDTCAPGIALSSDCSNGCADNPCLNGAQCIDTTTPFDTALSTLQNAGRSFQCVCDSVQLASGSTFFNNLCDDGCKENGLAHNKCGAQNTCTDTHDQEPFGYSCTCKDNRAASAANSQPNCDGCVSGYERSGDNCVLPTTTTKEPTTTTTTTTEAPTTTEEPTENETTTVTPLSAEECICGEEGSEFLCDLLGCQWLLITAGAGGVVVVGGVATIVAVATGGGDGGDAGTEEAADSLEGLLAGGTRQNTRAKQLVKHMTYARPRPNVSSMGMKVPKGWH